MIINAQCSKLFLSRYEVCESWLYTTPEVVIGHIGGEDWARRLLGTLVTLLANDHELGAGKLQRC
jgi:hypothetical protein